jgi:hypothetical protein
MRLPEFGNEVVHLGCLLKASRELPHLRQPSSGQPVVLRTCLDQFVLHQPLVLRECLDKFLFGLQDWD